jgi:hypothetical protein
MILSRAGSVLLLLAVAVVSACEAPGGAQGTGSPGSDLPATGSPPIETASAGSRPIDLSIEPVSRSRPSAEAQAALNACGANGPTGVGVSQAISIAGMGLIAHARDVPEYVNLWGTEPEIQTDRPAWVIQMVGRVEMGGGWADDPVCVVVDGRTTVFAPTTNGTATETIVPPTRPRSPSLALPPLAPLALTNHGQETGLRNKGRRRAEPDSLDRMNPGRSALVPGSVFAAGRLPWRPDVRQRHRIILPEVGLDRVSTEQPCLLGLTRSTEVIVLPHRRARSTSRRMASTTRSGRSNWITWVLSSAIVSR